MDGCLREALAVKLTPRTATHSYQDPLDALWLATARQLGLAVRRSTDVYASTDGQGVMTLGSHETLDSDDCLAQMIFHECCHWLVEGTASERHGEVLCGLHGQPVRPGRAARSS